LFQIGTILALRVNTKVLLGFGDFFVLKNCVQKISVKKVLPLKMRSHPLQGSQKNNGEKCPTRAALEKNTKKGHT